jgi:hypothetical protein
METALISGFDGPDDPSADVWIEAGDRVIGGRVMRRAFVRQR